MSELRPAAASHTPLVDSHCHLQILAERDGAAGVERALEQAVGAGVVQIVCPGLNLEDSDRCREVAEAYPGVFFTVGWHPMSRPPPIEPSSTRSISCSGTRARWASVRWGSTVLATGVPRDVAAGAAGRSSSDAGIGACPLPARGHPRS